MNPKAALSWYIMERRFWRGIVNKPIAVTILLFAVSTVVAESSAVRPELCPASNEPNPRGGHVLRFPELELRHAGAAWHTDGRPVWTFTDIDGRPGYRLGFSDRGHDSFTDWSTSSRHTLPLCPNRSYVLSVLLWASFPRPAEVNLGVKFLDHGGKQIIWALNGLPNKTAGWQRWEWEITTDPRTAHGVFTLLLIGLPLEGTELALADVALVELPPKPLSAFQPGEGATFRGGPGALPMKVEEVEETDGNVTVQTTGARYTFLVDEQAIVGQQRLERQREVVRWRSSVPLSGLQVKHKNDLECVLANEHITFGIQCDSLMLVVPHTELALTARSTIGGR